MTHNGREIIIYYHPFPESLQGKAGLTILYRDRYYIAIDSKAPEDMQPFYLGHELGHIFMGHFEAPEQGTPEQEAKANRAAWSFYWAYKTGRLERREAKRDAAQRKRN